MVSFRETPSQTCRGVEALVIFVCLSRTFPLFLAHVWCLIHVLIVLLSLLNSLFYQKEKGNSKNRFKCCFKMYLFMCVWFRWSCGGNALYDFGINLILLQSIRSHCFACICMDVSVGQVMGSWIDCFVSYSNSQKTRVLFSSFTEFHLGDLLILVHKSFVECITSYYFRLMTC